MDMGKLGPALLKVGAPILKGLLENAVGGIGGKIAGAAIDALAESLGTEATPDAIATKIDLNPSMATPIVQQMESEMVKTLDIGTGDLTEYLALLKVDAASEGILSRIWRPLFAVIYTFLFATQVLTVCWLAWTRQWGTLQELGDVLTFLTFMNVAALGVLGIQIWKRTEEKKSGV
jgi:hypothetical protein